MPHPGARRVLLLDLDGTLVDSAPDLAVAVNRLLAEAGAAPLALAEVTAMVGDGARVLVRRALAARGLAHDEDAATARFLALYGEGLAVHSPYPGVAKVLGALAAEGWRLAVCTNKPAAASRALLDQLALTPLFEAVAGGDSFAVKKPDPVHLHDTLALLGADAGSAVMVGDGRNDLLAARAAGLPAIWAAYGYGGAAAAALPQAARLAAFVELPGALAKLARSAAGA